MSDQEADLNGQGLWRRSMHTVAQYFMFNLKDEIADPVGCLGMMLSRTSSRPCNVLCTNACAVLMLSWDVAGESPDIAELSNLYTVPAAI